MSKLILKKEREVLLYNIIIFKPFVTKSRSKKLKGQKREVVVYASSTVDLYIFIFILSLKA